VNSDDAIVEKAKRGDRAAFRSLFLAYRHQVARVIQRFVPREDVEDVAQEVFLHVFRSLPSFRGDARFSTWLHRLALNVARMHLRRGKSRPKLTLAGNDERKVLERPSLVDPALDAERNERVRALYRLLENLSEKKREALILHDLEGLPADEIAKILDIPVMTVRTRVFYARKELYAALAQDAALGSVARAMGIAAAEEVEP
jgi:RNA polymerase sigma-70 factor (ECF subfamily)